MHLALQLTLLISTLAAALPFEGASDPRILAPRSRTYAIVNVDGGSTTIPPKPTTVVEDKTKTVQVTDAPTTVTDKDTATATAVPAPSSIQTSDSSSTSSPKSTPSQPAQETPTPSIVTVIVTESAAPTEYYDDGLWKTRYPIKTFATATTTVAA
jgi:hypothetical protein